MTTKHNRERYRQNAVPKESVKFSEALDTAIILVLLLLCFWMIWDAPLFVQWWKSTVFKGV